METQIINNKLVCSDGGNYSVNAAVVLESIRKSTDASFSKQIRLLINLAGNLPACSGNMLEFHFDRKDAWFDFAFRLNRDFDKPLLSKHLQLYATTPAIEKGYKQLVNQQGEFRFGIENVCFEYDCPFCTDPSLFLDIQKDAVFQPEKIFDVLAYITRAFNHPLYCKLLDFLKKLKDNGCWVIYYGLMLSRASDSIRMTINGVKPGTLINTLKNLGWNGNYDVLQNIKDGFLDCGNRIVLAVGFNNRLSVKLRVEFFASESNVFLNKLCAEKIISEEQQHILKVWPGTVRLDHKVSEGLSQLHQRPISDVFKRINHFKFTIENNQVKTKAYLYYCF